MELSDRILVLCGGRVSGILDGRTADKNEVGLMMTRLGGSGSGAQKTQEEKETAVESGKEENHAGKEEG